jgi:hypothetical protein
MPPQQPERLLDLFDDGGDLSAHDSDPTADVMACRGSCNADFAAT